MKITIQYDEDSLWGRADPIAEGYDPEESTVRFEEILSGMISDKFPNAEFVIVPGDDDVVRVDGESQSESGSARVVLFLIDRAWYADWQVLEGE